MEFRDYNAALAAHTNWRRMISAEIGRYSKGWLYDRESKYGLQATIPSSVAFHHMIEDTVNADACWMSYEMMQLTVSAMEGFDTNEPFIFEDAFIPHGFMVLPEPFYSRDINGHRMCMRAYLWRVVEHACAVVEKNDGEAVRYTYDVNHPDAIETWPVLRISTLSHVDDEDDFTEALADDLAYQRESGWMWGVVHATTIPLPLINKEDELRGEGDQTGAWLKFFRVAQRLMGDRIITSERRQAARPLRREAQRLGYDPHAPRVIELRRPTQRDSDPEGERTRDVEWTHRWISRGHWRNQWYPSEGRHKQIRIPASVKGPEHLPLIVRDQVWNWDR